jgi:phosphatidylglycerol lysyltransferase
MCAYGSNSLAFFGQAPHNSHFLAPDGAGLVHYRLVNHVAVVLGDPVCAPEAREQVTQSFLDVCARHHWRVAFYQASPAYLATYHALGLRAWKMGEEAILSPQTFTLWGSAMANVRTSARRAERDAVRISWYEGVPPAAVMQQLEHVSSAWLEHKAGSHAAETGFSTGRLDELIESAERADAIAHLPVPFSSSSQVVPRFVTGVATTSMGTACAFVTFTPIYGGVTPEAIPAGNQSSGQGWGWSLDLMRRVPDAPPGVMELLLVRALERFRSCRAHVVSFGLALADTSQEMTPVERKLVSLATGGLHLMEHRETLFNFKQKFHPSWQSRYLVTNTTLALPKIALAVLRLCNYSGGGLARLLRGTFKQFLRYCLVGGANTLIDLLVLNFLLWGFPTSNVQSLVLYNSVAYASGAVTSFFLNKYWTFGRKQRTTSREVVRFAIVLFLEILYSNGLVWLAGKALHPLITNPTLWGNASKLLAVAAGAVLSYVFMRFWTFAGNNPSKERRDNVIS